MKKVISIMAIIFIITFIGIYLKPLSTEIYTNKSFMTIMYNSIDGNSYYYKYDLKTNEYKTIYYKKNNGYSDGVVSRDGRNFYYTNKDSKGNYNLYKINTEDSSHESEQLTNNIKIDIFSNSDNKMFCRVKQSNHRNNSLAILNLSNNILNICNKNETESDIFNLEYSPFTHKIYTIERSIKDMDTVHLPNMPLHKIIEYDDNGNKLKELFEIKGFIHNISISKDGKSALVSVTEDTNLDKIYTVDLNNSNKKLILESKQDYIVAHAKYSFDDRGFYFLCTNANSKILENDGYHVEKSNGIYYYDFKTKNISKIFEKEDGMVNDYNIQY